MRIVSYLGEEGPRRGIVDGAQVRDAGAGFELLAPGPVVGTLDDLHLLAPVPHPGKVIGIGRNYADHARETGAAVPDRPQLFGMWSNAVVGPGAPIRYPAITAALDYEAELVVVIGRTASQVSAAHALDHVLGYTCGNDVSARDLQHGDTQWIRGKALDSFAPIGPWIVTADEIPDPQALHIRGLVNGEVRQDDTTAHMLFGVAELIEFITEAITLEPGDLIFTGTPAGVGHGMEPKGYLAVGDTVQVEVEGIGTLENPVA